MNYFLVRFERCLVCRGSARIHILSPAEAELASVWMAPKDVARFKAAGRAGR